MERGGFTGGKGDSATITITDDGDGINIEVLLSHAPHATEADESAVEAVADIFFRAVGRPLWKLCLIKNRDD